ncbi:MAG: YraN family protein [Actinomycetota bacterium]|nr:YraN family protein [Actinomycetota bacterium]
MGVGHVPPDPVRAEGSGADVQGRQRGRAALDRDLGPAASSGRDLSSQARGRFGENEAARWYVRHGYRVLARNWRCSFGELDLVLAGDGCIVFCEVKARASAEFGGPEGAVHWAKQRRLRRLAAAWLASERPAGLLEVRFDVAAVVGAKVHVIQHAF